MLGEGKQWICSSAALTEQEDMDFPDAPPWRAVCVQNVGQGEEERER